MSLTISQRKKLRQQAHHLKAILQIGKAGVSEAILKELDKNLEDHELVKLRIACEDQESFHQALAAITSQTDAELVQSIGHTVVLYRKNPDA